MGLGPALPALADVLPPDVLPNSRTVQKSRFLDAGGGGVDTCNQTDSRDPQQAGGGRGDDQQADSHSVPTRHTIFVLYARNFASEGGYWPQERVTKILMDLLSIALFFLSVLNIYLSMASLAFFNLDEFETSTLLYSMWGSSAGMVVVSILGCQAIRTGPSRKHIIWFIALLILSLGLYIAFTFIYHHFYVVLKRIDSRGVAAFADSSGEESQLLDSFRQEYIDQWKVGHCGGGNCIPENCSGSDLSFEPIKCEEENIQLFLNNWAMDYRGTQEQFLSCRENALSRHAGSSSGEINSWCRSRDLYVHEYARQATFLFGVLTVQCPIMTVQLVLAITVLIYRWHGKERTTGWHRPVLCDADVQKTPLKPGGSGRKLWELFGRLPRKIGGRVGSDDAGGECRVGLTSPRGRQEGSATDSSGRPGPHEKNADPPRVKV
ncbi:hypothetical protein Pmar_PMAR008713 [Perkinsus marinus ATCC 50983]|uniref:Uncharacterized protein n=1 Tax=Perkinsus marinus (strain ATCC 50983 / TXsc) TaxID=423536 RepID=C5L0T1_PERM5|nr:hypothetical protein Pmar_PMAR008713 [Perkinsus marinus ATCC 50983]EER09573.1 hypothetical protein Pmar_PMAR008713 [Perkinsus marinus ATCC 50983]|eukprot:XP_002777778.1 hypothetical protein Pmar_PMAR008713 [Perkinsus marinus ATCC 50983]